MVSGINPTRNCPENDRDKGRWAKDKAVEALRELSKDIRNDIISAHGLGDMKRHPVSIEVRMRNVDTANKIRMKHSDRKRDRRTTGVNVSLATTLSTKIRIEIFKAIDAKYPSNDCRYYIPMHETRPTLKVTNNNTRISRILTYTDAVTKYGETLTKDDLTMAYERAGDHYQGQLCTTFVVLEDRYQVIRTNNRQGNNDPITRHIGNNSPPQRGNNKLSNTGR